MPEPRAGSVVSRLGLTSIAVLVIAYVLFAAGNLIIDVFEDQIYYFVWRGWGLLSLLAVPVGIATASIVRRNPALPRSLAQWSLVGGVLGFMTALPASGMYLLYWPAPALLTSVTVAIGIYAALMTRILLPRAMRASASGLLAQGPTLLLVLSISIVGGCAGFLAVRDAPVAPSIVGYLQDRYGFGQTGLSMSACGLVGLWLGTSHHSWRVAAAGTLAGSVVGFFIGFGADSTGAGFTFETWMGSATLGALLLIPLAYVAKSIDAMRVGSLVGSVLAALLATTLAHYSNNVFILVLAGLVLGGLAAYGVWLKLKVDVALQDQRRKSAMAG